MTIPANAGTATSTAKISDINALITAINTELALYATKASVDALTTRVAALEASIATNQTAISTMGVRVKTLEDKPAVPDLTVRVKALENEPDPVIPPDLSDRVDALEDAVGHLTVPASATGTDPSMLSPIPHQRRAASEGIELVYDQATLYLGDMELHARRVAENTWRLVASLNYITVSQIAWTYDETVRGTAEEVYAHAMARLEELAELKPQHDAVHARVREMSEGRP